MELHCSKWTEWSLPLTPSCTVHPFWFPFSLVPCRPPPINIVFISIPVRNSISIICPIILTAHPHSPMGGVAQRSVHGWMRVSGGRGSDNVWPSLSTTGIFQLQALDYPHGTAHGINPVISVQHHGFSCYFFLFDLRLSHGPLLLSIFRNLFMYFHKREASRIYPDPANLICLLPCFFHRSLSGQWFVNHLVSLLKIQSARMNNRYGAVVVFVCCLSRSSYSGCPFVGWIQFFLVLLLSSFCIPFPVISPSFDDKI